MYGSVLDEVIDKKSCEQLKSLFRTSQKSTENSRASGSSGEFLKKLRADSRTSEKFSRLQRLVSKPP